MSYGERGVNQDIGPSPSEQSGKVFMEDIASIYAENASPPIPVEAASLDTKLRTARFRLFEIDHFVQLARQPRNGEGGQCGR